MDTGVSKVSQRRYEADTYLLKESRKMLIKPVIICNYKKCRRADDVFLENANIKANKETVMAMLAQKFDFENIDGNFHVLENRNKADLQGSLKALANSFNDRPPDLFMCFIFSPGGGDYFYDNQTGADKIGDSEKVPFRELFDIFNGSQCPGLLMRPKLFFIQTIRKKRELSDHMFFADGRSLIPPLKTMPVEADFFVYTTQVLERDDLDEMTEKQFVEALKEKIKLWNASTDIMEFTVAVNGSCKDPVPLCTSQLTKQLLFHFE